MPPRPPFRLLALAALLSSAACSAAVDPLTPVAIDFAGGTPVPLTRLRADASPLRYNSGFAGPRRLVVQDAGTWSTAWATIWQGTTPAPALPDVDFTREMLVVAALGERPSGGFAILVDSAVSTRNELVVFVRSIAPGPHCFTTAALTQPVDVARLPASTLPVRFEERATVMDCE